MLYNVLLVSWCSSSKKPRDAVFTQTEIRVFHNKRLLCFYLFIILILFSISSFNKVFSFYKPFWKSFIPYVIRNNFRPSLFAAHSGCFPPATARGNWLVLKYWDISGKISLNHTTNVEYNSLILCIVDPLRTRYQLKGFKINLSEWTVLYCNTRDKSIKEGKIREKTLNMNVNLFCFWQI